MVYLFLLRDWNGFVDGFDRWGDGQMIDAAAAVVARRLGMTRCRTIAETGGLEVFVEVGLESEGFMALAAVVRFGGRMRLHVGS